MTVHWLLDASVFDTYHEELAAAIMRNGCAVKSINRPNAPYRWDDVQDSFRKAFPKGSCVVTHGDIDLVNRVLSAGDWTPGAIATVKNFFCTSYYPHFGRFLLNRDYIMLPFGELARCGDFLFATIGRDGNVFIRPDSPLKLFTGLVANQEAFARDLDFMAFYEFPVDTLVVVSSPKIIESEWRFMVANQKIVAGSLYKHEDQLIAEECTDRNALDLASAVLAVGHEPDPVWVMDICKTSDGRYHLLEIGGFSFANMYGCDKVAVVKAVSQVAAEIHAKARSK